MKKWNTRLLLICCLALVLTGCSKNNNETNAPTTEAATEGNTDAATESGTEEAVPEVRTEYMALDYVDLGEYKGLELAAADVEVTEEEVQEVVDEVLVKLHTEIMDRAVEEGDTVNIDYEGLKDGVAFQGEPHRDLILRLVPVSLFRALKMDSLVLNRAKKLHLI